MLNAHGKAEPLQWTAAAPNFEEKTLQNI